MKLLGMDFNLKLFFYLYGLNGLIVIDIVLITIAMIFQIPPDVALDIQIFDFFVCIILLCEWTINFYLSSPKKDFLKDKEHILALIASIPFDAVLPVVIPGINLLRYLRLLKLVRVLILFNRFFIGIKKFINKTNIDKIVFGGVLIVLIFTGLLYHFGPSYGLFDDFYFVVVTLTTVGYGDITPKTYNEKIISLMIITLGIFIFSTITAAISSFLTERLMKKDNYNIEKSLNEKFETMNDKLDSLEEENKVLRDEIKELKELLEK